MSPGISFVFLFLFPFTVNSQRLIEFDNHEYVKIYITHVIKILDGDKNINPDDLYGFVNFGRSTFELELFSKKTNDLISSEFYHFSESQTHFFLSEMKGTYGKLDYMETYRLDRSNQNVNDETEVSFILSGGTILARITGTYTANKKNIYTIVASGAINP